MDRDNINFINIESTYYLAPDKKGYKGYVILREALKKSDKVGIAKVIISTKEYLAAVSTLDDALVLHLLHYHDEIRDLSEFNIPTNDLKKYKVTTKEIDIAKQLISSMTEKWKPEKYKDEYKEAVAKWVKAKVKHLPGSKMKQRSATPKTANTVNFFDLLKKSLDESKLSSKTNSVKKKTKTKTHIAHSKVTHKKALHKRTSSAKH